jgi:hypothetical protein
MGKVKELSLDIISQIRVWQARDGAFEATISPNLLPQYALDDIKDLGHVPFVSILGRYKIDSNGECHISYANFVTDSSSIELKDKDLDILGMYVEVFLTKRNNGYAKT